MNAAARNALQTERTVDITTTGRKSGQMRRIEMWFHNVDDEIYLTGTPGRRDWYANLMADPAFVFHLKQSVVLDLPARGAPVLEAAERRRVLTAITRRVGATGRIEDWMRDAPLIHVTFDR